MFAPKVDADGNELGTYLGWNIAAGGARPFHQGQICNDVGGMVRFAKTQTERIAAGDPRLSLEERYGTNEGYVNAVRKAAERAVAARFLLQEDAERLVREAGGSRVLR